MYVCLASLDALPFPQRPDDIFPVKILWGALLPNPPSGSCDTTAKPNWHLNLPLASANGSNRVIWLACLVKPGCNTCSAHICSFGRICSQSLCYHLFAIFEQCMCSFYLSMSEEFTLKTWSGEGIQGAESCAEDQQAANLVEAFLEQFSRIKGSDK